MDRVRSEPDRGRGEAPYRVSRESRDDSRSRRGRAGDSMAWRGAVATTRCERQPANGSRHVETASCVSAGPAARPFSWLKADGCGQRTAPEVGALSGSGRGPDASKQRIRGPAPRAGPGRRPPPVLAVAGQDAEGLGAASGSTDPGAGPGVPTRQGTAGRLSRRDGVAGPLTRGKGLTAVRAACQERGPRTRAGVESGKRVTRRAARIRARVGEEVRGKCRDTEEGERRFTPSDPGRSRARGAALFSLASWPLIRFCAHPPASAMPRPASRAGPGRTASVSRPLRWVQRIS